MPTVVEIINLYPIAEYLAANDIPKKGLFGGGTDINLPEKISNIGRSVLNRYNADQPVAAVGATGNITMIFIGFRGDKMEIVVNGISLGIFERGVGDTDTDILSASIASFFDGVNDFSFVPSGSDIDIGAPASLGATVNGKLVVNYTITSTYPYVILDPTTMITSSTALAHGISVVQGGVVFFDNSGFCISTSPNPDLSDTVFSAGPGTGQLGITLTGLASGTLYYIRMYGTYNTTTTIYSEQSSFTTL